MTFLKSLSKREKTLVAILFLLLVCFGSMRFFIVPSLQKISASKQALAEIDTRIQQIEIEKQAYADLGEKIDGEFMAYDENIYFKHNLTPTEVDALLQGFALNAGLTVVSCEIANPILQPIAPYSKTEEIFQYPLKEKRFEFDQTGYEDYQQRLDAILENQNDTPHEGEMIPLYKATIGISGTPESLMNMLDAITGLDQSILVTGFQGSISADGIFTGSVTTDMYYLD